MASLPKPADVQPNEELNDSWVDVHFAQTPPPEPADAKAENDVISSSVITDAKLAAAGLSDALAELLPPSPPPHGARSPVHTLPPLLASQHADVAAAAAELIPLGADVTADGRSLMERLLQDAQRESRTPSQPGSLNASLNASHIGSLAGSQAGSQPCSAGPSQASSRKPSEGGSSPKSPPSPPPGLTSDSTHEMIKEKEGGTDWIWEWSSRPEIVPAFDQLSDRMRHPGPRRGVRRSAIRRHTSLFCLANLPTLLLTHAATFFLGAAAVLMYMKKYCNIPAIAPAAASALD